MRISAVLLVLLALVPAGFAGTDPRAEQERLTPADMALARKATLRPGDLAAGWRRISPGSDENKVPRCPGYAPDFSKFTITGKSLAAFQGPTGATILSNVEVYRSRADAVGDFRVGAKPALARCIGLLLNEGAPESQGFTVDVVSSRQVAAPRVGERAAAYRLVAEVSAAAATVKLYVDVLLFQQGRSIGGLVFTGAFEPVRGQAALARSVDARLR
jgi:hypothetical protein